MMSSIAALSIVIIHLRLLHHNSSGCLPRPVSLLPSPPMPQAFQSLSRQKTDLAVLSLP
jgi:hypothetical protein